MLLWIADTTKPPAATEVTDHRLPTTAHTTQPWRIHEIARDFRVEDVWALPTPGGPDDFPLLVDTAATTDILPFRHLIVYPRMLDEIGRRWRARAGRAMLQTGRDASRPGAGP
jgi:hypothetical protein